MSKKIKSLLNDLLDSKQQNREDKLNKLWDIIEKPMRTQLIKELMKIMNRKFASPEFREAWILEELEKTTASENFKKELMAELEKYHE